MFQNSWYIAVFLCGTIGLPFSIKNFSIFIIGYLISSRETIVMERLNK